MHSGKTIEGQEENKTRRKIKCMLFRLQAKKGGIRGNLEFKWKLRFNRK